MKNISIILIISLCCVSCAKDKTYLEEIYNDPGYALGTVSSSLSVGLSFSTTYYYTYTVDGVSYDGEKSTFSFGTGSDATGMNFLVVYKLSNPEESDINLSYKFYSESEFENAVETFKTNPPKP